MKNKTLFNNKYSAVFSVVLLIAASTVFELVFPKLTLDLSKTAAQALLKTVLYILPFSFLALITKPYQKKESVKPDISLCAFFLLLCLCSSVIFSLLHLQSAEAATGDATENIFAAFAVSCIITPIAEELVFRRVLLFSLSFYGKSFALVSSGMIFALFHARASIPNALFSGFVLALSALYTNSIKTSCAVHFANNALAFCFSHFDFLGNFYSYLILFLILIFASLISRRKILGFFAFCKNDIPSHSHCTDKTAYILTSAAVLLLILERCFFI